MGLGVIPSRQARGVAIRAHCLRVEIGCFAVRAFPALLRGFDRPEGKLSRHVRKSRQKRFCEVVFLLLSSLDRPSGQTDTGRPAEHQHTSAGHQRRPGTAQPARMPGVHAGGCAHRAQAVGPRRAAVVCAGGFPSIASVRCSFLYRMRQPSICSTADHRRQKARRHAGGQSKGRACGICRARERDSFSFFLFIFCCTGGKIKILG